MAASGKHLVQVGFMRCYDRGYRQVKELIDSGKFGAPMVTGRTYCADGVADDYAPPQWLLPIPQSTRSTFVAWLANDEWDEVQCIMPKTNSKG